MKRLLRQIKTDEDVERLRKALNNYKKYLEDSDITELTYIKHFSTWVSTWEDWLDYETEAAVSNVFRLIRDDAK